MHRPALALAILVLTVAPAVAAEKAFSGPSSWDHAVVGASGGGVWKHEGQTLAVLHDAATPVADVVAMVKRNVSSGNVTLSKEADRDCAGGKAKVFDMLFGEGSPKTVIRQWIIPDGPGNLRVTYTRNEKQPNQPDVDAAVAAFCG